MKSSEGKGIKEKKVLCNFCHKPIHIDHLSLIYGDKGKKVWCCDNICCLIEAKEKVKL